MSEIQACGMALIHISFPYIRPSAVRPPTIPGRADPLGLLLFSAVRP